MPQSLCTTFPVTYQLCFFLLVSRSPPDLVPESRTELSVAKARPRERPRCKFPVPFYWSSLPHGSTLLPLPYKRNSSLRSPSRPDLKTKPPSANVEARIPETTTSSFLHSRTTRAISNSHFEELSTFIHASPKEAPTTRIRSAKSSERLVTVPMVSLAPTLNTAIRLVYVCIHSCLLQPSISYHSPNLTRPLEKKHCIFARLVTSTDCVGVAGCELDVDTGSIPGWTFLKIRNTFAVELYHSPSSRNRSQEEPSTSRYCGTIHVISLSYEYEGLSKITHLFNSIHHFRTLSRTVYRRPHYRCTRASRSMDLRNISRN